MSTELEPAYIDDFGFRLVHILSNVTKSPFTEIPKRPLELLAWDNVNSRFAVADSENLIVGSTVDLSAFVSQSKDAGNSGASTIEDLESSIVVPQQGINTVKFVQDKLFVVVGDTVYTLPDVSTATPLQELAKLDSGIISLKATITGNVAALTANHTLNVLSTISSDRVKLLASDVTAFDWIQDSGESIIVTTQQNETRIISTTTGDTVSTLPNPPIEDPESKAFHISTFLKDIYLVAYASQAGSEEDDIQEPTLYFITPEGPVDIPGLLFPVPDVSRDYNIATSQLHGWSDKFPDLIIALSSLSSDVAVLTKDSILEALNDTDRAALPLDADTYMDSLPVGATVDITNTVPIRTEISKSIEDESVDPLPRLVVLTNDNKLCVWDIFEIEGIKSKQLKSLKDLQSVVKSNSESGPKLESLPQPQTSKPVEAFKAPENPFASSSAAPNPFNTTTTNVFGNSGAFLASSSSASTKSPFGSIGTQKESPVAGKDSFSFGGLDKQISDTSRITSGHVAGLSDDDDESSESDGLGIDSDVEESTIRKPTSLQSASGPTTFGSAAGPTSFGSSTAGPTSFGNSSFGSSTAGPTSFGSTAFGSTSAAGPTSFGSTSFGSSTNAAGPTSFGSSAFGASSTKTPGAFGSAAFGAPTNAGTTTFGSTPFGASSSAGGSTAFGSNSFGASTFGSAGFKFGAQNDSKDANTTGDSPFSNIGKQKANTFGFGSLDNSKTAFASGSSSSPFGNLSSKKEPEKVLAAEEASSNESFTVVEHPDDEKPEEDTAEEQYEEEDLSAENETQQESVDRSEEAEEEEEENEENEEEVKPETEDEIEEAENKDVQADKEEPEESESVIPDSDSLPEDDDATRLETVETAPNAEKPTEEDFKDIEASQPQEQYSQAESVTADQKEEERTTEARTATQTSAPEELEPGSVSKLSKEEKETTLIALLKSLDLGKDDLKRLISEAGIEPPTEDKSTATTPIVSEAANTTEPESVSRGVATYDSNATEDAQVETSTEKDELYLSQQQVPPSISNYLILNNVDRPAAKEEAGAVQRKIEDLFYFVEGHLEILTRNMENMGAFIDAHEAVDVPHTSKSLPYPTYWKLDEALTVADFIDAEIATAAEITEETAELEQSTEEAFQDTVLSQEKAVEVNNLITALENLSKNAKLAESLHELTFPHEKLRREISSKLHNLDDKASDCDIKFFIFDILSKIKTLKRSDDSIAFWTDVVDKLHQAIRSHSLKVHELKNAVAAAVVSSSGDEDDDGFESGRSTPSSSASSDDLVILDVSSLRRSRDSKLEIGQALRSRALHVPQSSIKF